MLFLNCNILQGASIIDLFQNCLVVSQILGGAFVQIFYWYVREKWGVSSAWWHVRTVVRFALLDQCQKVSVYGALSQLPYIWDSDKQEQKSIRGGDASHKRGALFIGKIGYHCVILLYCETLLQVLLGIYCKRFYRILLFTMSLLFYVFEVGEAKSATHSVLMMLTLNGLFQKKFQVFTLPFLGTREIPRNFFLITPIKFQIVFVSQEYIYCN